MVSPLYFKCVDVLEGSACYKMLDRAANRLCDLEVLWICVAFLTLLLYYRFCEKCNFSKFR